MLKNLVKNSFWIAIALFCATQMSYAQGSGPNIENPFPASSALLNIASDASQSLVPGPGQLIVPYTRFPTTVQTGFDELDVFLSYKFSLGPIDITVGNIAFFINRDATTSEVDLLPETFHGFHFIWNVPD